ncbi:diaminopimelate decarboxylase [Brumimicrobium aurantiacum]|uniref:Diaminopimelate decarboxylase n=1 Tax=Brumimicrobium aurantiacum TaxID=1737063 RepID=A0A3E1EZX9_9FLAO|nr:diaminopimelate decarboxylase [Brumimicrobium aurantiacum]RFC55132.1 diaminopimelate decarboxylase [Brumimicrobium aurantiacum]
MNLENIKQQKTPFYYYDLALLNETLEDAKINAQKYNYHIHYALKANTNTKILQPIKELGFGADCVSGNEVLRALEVGFAPAEIAFAGVGKSDEEINIGLDNDIFAFNCESIEEIEVINELAKAKNKIAKIALRLNPNVDAKTHKYITTGLEENKFGINSWELENIIDILPKLENIVLTGLHFHIGSQITSMTPFKNLCIRVNELNTWFKEQNIEIKHLNLGGGLGIDYNEPEANPIPDFELFFGVFNQFLEPFPHQEIHFELGRSLVANCGSLISKVLYIKKGIKTNFAILDAGMTELIRPAIYQAYHNIENLTSTSNEVEFYDVVGPICESSDCFGKRVQLKETKRGDFIKIHSTGAYGEVMSSKYNLREPNPVIYKD